MEIWAEPEMSNSVYAGGSPDLSLPRRPQHQKLDALNHRSWRLFAGGAFQCRLAAFEFRIGKKRQGRVGAQSGALRELSQGVTSLLRHPLQVFDRESSEPKPRHNLFERGKLRHDPEPSWE